MPGLISRNLFVFVGAVLIFVYYCSQSYEPAIRRHRGHPHHFVDGQQPVAESLESAEPPAGLVPHDIDPMSDGDSPSESSTAAPTEEVEEPKWYFQDDLPFANPDFDTRKLRQYAPHNYRGPGHDTFATYFATRNSTLQDPYFQAAQQLAYRLLWDPRSRSTQYPFTVFVAPFVSREQRDLLTAAGALVRELELVDGHEPLPGFGRWRDLFSKLHLWNQTDFQRIAFLDVDAFPFQNVDGLFDAAPAQLCRADRLPPEDAARARDICAYHFSGVALGLSDQVNVGVMVLQPNAAMHARLLRESGRPENYDRSTAEQAFLNFAFRPDGPFPLHLLDRVWNGFFPRQDEIAALKIVHEKLWSIERTGEAGLQWLKDYFGDTWADMLALYESPGFERIRARDGRV